MNKGSLVHEDYFDLFKNNNIKYNKYTSSQIQPSSLDLTLSEECYEIEASFLSPNTNIRDKLTNIINKKGSIIINKKRWNLQLKSRTR